MTSSTIYTSRTGERVGTQQQGKLRCDSHLVCAMPVTISKIKDEQAG